MNEVPAILHDASGLVATVERAKALLDEGDVIAAKVLAARAYDDAKNAIRLAKRFKAAQSLIDKARSLQADALLIETEAKIQIADEWDAAQKAGLVSKGGRPTRVFKKSEDSFTAAEAGLDRKEIHQARKLREVEREMPGAIKALISSKLQKGVGPTRSMLKELHVSNEWPVSKAGFSRRFSVEFDSGLTTHNQLGVMVARARHMARFLKAVQSHGVPIEPNAPIEKMISAARLEALWEETK